MNEKELDSEIIKKIIRFSFEEISKVEKNKKTKKDAVMTIANFIKGAVENEDKEA